MAKQTRHIVIKMDTKGSKELRKISSQFGKMNRNVKSSASSLKTLKSAFLGFASVYSVGAIIKAADDFQLLKDRIKVFTGSAEKAKDVFKDLALSAQYTKTSISSLAEVYNRVAIATSDLNLSSDQILATTTALQQTFRLSGSTMAEATAATIQLTQGLSSGQLRGQELRSVLEANGIFVKILAKELGIGRGQLIKFAESGKITSDVVLNALGKNFRELNTQAAGLGQTFGQTLTIALDLFKVKLDGLNENFNLNGKFAKGMQFFIDNFEVFGKVLLAIVSTGVILKIVSQVSVMITTFKAGAVATTLLTGGLNVLLTVISFVAIEAATNWDSFRLRFEYAGLSVLKWINNMEKKFYSFAATLLEVVPFASKALKGIISVLQLKSASKGSDIELKLKGISNELDKLNKKSEKRDLDAYIKRMEDALSGGVNVKIQAIAGKFSKLNEAYKIGAINLVEYNYQIKEIEKSNLNKKFDEGKISLDEYNNSMLKVTDNLSEGSPLQTGIANYVKQSGTLANNIAGAISGTFTRLEDSLFEFIKKGKFEFSKFTQAILDDLTKIIIRASIVQPLAQGILGGFGGGATAGTSITTTGTGSDFASYSAKGNSFSSGQIQAFASGGIVDKPTMFGFGSGKTGLMGEAGSEAILPLKRGPSGDLGVQASQSNVQVNIINNAPNVETETRESQNAHGDKVLDVLIISKVKDGFANGSFDKTLGMQYGLRRRGV